MSKLAKAQDLYLRGFSSTYIRRRTGVLWCEVKHSLADSSKEAIVRYQVSYIERKWTLEQIQDAWIWLQEHKEESREKASHHTLTVLGCQFGQYQRVFHRILPKIIT